MRVAVIGAGNMGCVYGANLARVGVAVTMVDTWPEHVEAMRDHGLAMEGLNGTFTAAVDAVTDGSELSGIDAAIVLVNAYDTAVAAQTAKQVLKPDGYALTLQNGMGNVETLTAALGERRVLAGLSFHSGDLKGPGEVTHTLTGPTYLGELDRSRSERLLHLAGLIEEAQLNPVLEDDIIVSIWSKFVHNCGINALCAITELRPGNIREVPELDEFQTGIIEETLALVEAKGITLPDPDPMTTVKVYCADKFHRVSMAQHLARGRLTEIEALNGYVARESAKLGLAAPCNEALTRLMKGRHHTPENTTTVGN